MGGSSIPIIYQGIRLVGREVKGKNPYPCVTKGLSLDWGVKGGHFFNSP